VVSEAGRRCVECRRCRIAGAGVVEAQEPPAMGPVPPQGRLRAQAVSREGAGGRRGAAAASEAAAHQGKTARRRMGPVQGPQGVGREYLQGS
jgi:hypothetical protein